MEIVSALGTIPVKRLKNSWALVPHEALTQFQAMVELLSPVKNYLQLRNYMNSNFNEHTPMIPYVGKFP